MQTVVDDRDRLRHVARSWDLPLVTAEAVILVIIVVLIGAAGVVGWLIGRDGPSGGTTTVTVTTIR